jgi:hypothetical protein
VEPSSLGDPAAGKADEGAALTLSEAEINGVVDAVTDYFDAHWRYELSGCEVAGLRVDIKGQPQDGSVGTEMAYRCSGRIAWNAFESCIVVFDTDPRSGRPVDFRTDDCDI